MLPLWLLIATAGFLPYPQDPVPRGEPVRRLTVTGIVKAASGSAVPGATVELKDTATGTRMAAETGSDGRYSFANVRPGRYDLKATLPGFAQVERSVDLALPAPGGGAGSGTKVLDLVFGGPVPVGDPTPSSGPQKFESLQKTFQNDLDLQRWLDAQLRAGRRLQSVIPVAVKTSIFITVETDPDVSVVQIVLFVNEPLAPARLGERVNQHPDKRLAGVHRLSASSYLMVLVHETR